MAAAAGDKRGHCQTRQRRAGATAGRGRRTSAIGNRPLPAGTDTGMDIGYQPALAAAELYGLARLQAAIDQYAVLDDAKITSPHRAWNRLYMVITAMPCCSGNIFPMIDGL